MSEVSSWTHDIDEIDFVDSDGNPVSTVRAAGGEEVRFDPSVLEEAVARTVRTSVQEHCSDGSLPLACKVVDGLIG